MIEKNSPPFSPASGRNKMFNLEQSITEWRRQMIGGQIKSATTLDELESHLRENVRALLLTGKSENEAFQIATTPIGKSHRHENRIRQN
jgi:hypothetical protein